MSIVDGIILGSSLSVAACGCFSAARGWLAFKHAAMVAGVLLLLSAGAKVAAAFTAFEPDGLLHRGWVTDAEALSCSAHAWVAGVLLGACVRGAAWMRRFVSRHPVND